MEEQIPEEAILEAELEEQRLASQSDIAMMLDAIKQLTKAVGDLKKEVVEFRDEWDLAKKAGRF